MPQSPILIIIAVEARPRGKTDNATPRHPKPEQARLPVAYSDDFFRDQQRASDFAGLGFKV